MPRALDPVWALVISANAWAADALRAGSAGEGHAPLPTLGVGPPRALAQEALPRASHWDAGQPLPEECETGQWSVGSFLGGLLAGVAAAVLGTALALAQLRRAGQGEVDHAEAASDAGGREAAKEEASPAGKPEDDPASFANTDSSREVAPTRPEASGRHGCTDEVESLHLFWPRACFLVAMLLLQSVSSLILAGFGGLVERHTALIFFLTMIVGLGGNAGGQSMVLAVRGLATGKQVRVAQQLFRGLQLSTVIVPLAFLRVLLTHASFPIAVTVAIACLVVLVTSTSAGTSLPMLLLALGVDPAHGASMIQVLMDICGIAIVCAVAAAVLGA